MSETKRCEGMVYNPHGSWGNKSRPCTKRATVQSDGKWYCGTHSPEAKKARDQRCAAASQEKWKARQAKFRLETLAPDLLAFVRRVATCIPSNDVEVVTIHEARELVRRAEEQGNG